MHLAIIEPSKLTIFLIIQKPCLYYLQIQTNSFFKLLQTSLQISVFIRNNFPHNIYDLIKEYFFIYKLRDLQEYYKNQRRMEKENLNIALLQPRKVQNLFKGTQKIAFITNYYRINFMNTNDVLIQYSFSCEPSITQDSLEMLRKIIDNVRKELKQKIGLIHSKGYMIWGYKPLKGIFQVCSKFQLKGQQYNYKVQIKQAARYSFEDLQKFPTQKEKLIQCLTTGLQNVLRQNGYIEAGRGKYFLKDNFQKNILKDLGVSVNRGFKFNLSEVQDKLYLRVDSCSRILQTTSVLDAIKQLKPEAWHQLFNLTVTSNYGNFKTYQIQSIDSKLSPLSKLEQLNTTFKDYYQKQYGIKIKDLKQPLILIKEQKKRGEEGITKKTYLIPELVSLTGIPQSLKNNFTANREISKFCKVEPYDKMKEIETSLDLFDSPINKNYIQYKVGKQLICQGNILKQPTIKLFKDNIQFKNGITNLRGIVKNPGVFQNWLFVYSIGNNPGADAQDADIAVEALKKASETFGIKFSNPDFLEIKGRRVQEWKNKVLSDIQKYGVPQIVVFFENSSTEFYDELKMLMINEGIACQMIKKKTLLDPKKKLSAASKIVLQMNVKIGKPIWQIKRSHAFFQNKTVICGGISLSKSLSGFTLGFVGTLNSTSNQFYSSYQTNIKKKEEIPQKLLEDIFVKWFEQYLLKDKYMPQIILLYRQGLSQIQIKQQVPRQVEALKNAVKKFQQQTKNQTRIIYIMANRKVDSRILLKQNGIKTQNPSSGTILMGHLSSGKMFDFFLIPQYVTQGTCTPTHFIVAYQEFQIPAEAIAEFTFEECFNYFNWQGAVRVPSCLQYANKLSNFAGEHLKKKIISEGVKNKLYFL